MAKFIGSGRQKGILENMQIELKIRKKTVLSKILTSDMKKPMENVLGNEILEYFNETVEKTDVFYDEEEEELEKNRFWMNSVNLKKNDLLTTIDLYKSRLKFIETGNAILSIIALFLSEVEYELAYFPTFIKNNPQNIVNESYTGDSSRIIVSVICGLMCIISFHSCIYEYRVKREQKKIVNIRFFSSYYFTRLLIELVINILHPFPLIDFYFTLDILSLQIKYYFQTFLYAFMYLKLYHILRVLTVYTKYKTVQSEKYCDHYGGEADTIFALKALQKDYPFLILTLSLMFNVFFCGLILRMFEILNIQTKGDIDYNFYTNGMWNICVAMTTVGYGDFFAKTHIGRFITIYAIFAGIFIASLLMVALSKACEFDNNGLKSFRILRTRNHKKKLYEASILLIQNMFRQFLLRKTFSKKIKKNVKTKQFKQIAISKVLKKSNKFHDNNLNLVALKRDLQIYLMNRRNAKSSIEQETYISTDYKFVDLADRIYNDLNSLKKEFYKLDEFKFIISANIKQSEKILEHIENSIKLIKINVKNKFLKLIWKNEKGIHNYLEIKPVSNESNVSQDSIRHKELPFDKFFPYKKLTTLKDKNRIEKMLTDKVDLSYLKLKNKYKAQQIDSGYSNLNNDFYEDSQSKSFLQQDESLNNIVIKEEFYYMDKITRGLLKNKSKKTFDLLTDLKKMRLKISNEKANKAIWDEENSMAKNIQIKPLEERKEKNANQEISLEKNKEEVLPLNIEEIRIDNQMDNNAEIKFDQKIKNKIENRLENIIENKIENRLENKIEKKIEKNIENNIENIELKSETKKPLLTKLESKIKENQSISKEKEKENNKKKKEKPKIYKKEENYHSQEYAEETNLFRKQDNGGDAEIIKNQINNKIFNINKLLNGVANNHKKEKTNNLFTDESKVKSKDFHK